MLVKINHFGDDVDCLTVETMQSGDAYLEVRDDDDDNDSIRWNLLLNPEQRLALIEALTPPEAPHA